MVVLTGSFQLAHLHFHIPFLSKRYILNYLRNGELLCKDDKLKEELLVEAKFYQVQGIINQLEEETSSMSPRLHFPSLIINDENHFSALISWLPPNATCSLLFRASTDGKTAADFHRCCDNRGPTLLVIKCAEFIFGGYTSKSWVSGMKSITLLHEILAALNFSEFSDFSKNR